MPKHNTHITEAEQQEGTTEYMQSKWNRMQRNNIIKHKHTHTRTHTSDKQQKEKENMKHVTNIGENKMKKWGKQWKTRDTHVEHNWKHVEQCDKTSDTKKLKNVENWQHVANKWHNM
jgi:hypothetical protein